MTPSQICDFSGRNYYRWIFPSFLCLLTGSVVRGFNGCLRNVKLGKNTLSFSQPSQLVSDVRPRNIASGCRESCSPAKCPRFSDCINTATGYKCQCVPGHKRHGGACISSLTCANEDTCMNNGKCTYTQVKMGISYHCSCKRGYTGARCHIPIHACMHMECANGGTCLPNGVRSYTCNCLPGYTGTHCESYNPCASRKCYYGGKCVSLKDDYRCECPPLRTGKQCAAGNYCRFTDCHNGGTCHEQVDGAMCMCPSGFKGTNCELDINECLRDPCESHKICVNTFGSFYCNCSVVEGGANCAMLTVDGKEEGFSMVLVVVGGLVLLVIVAIVIIGIICCRGSGGMGIGGGAVGKHLYTGAQLDEDSATGYNNKYPLNQYNINHNNIPLDTLLHQHQHNAPPQYSDDQTSAAAAVMYDPAIDACFSDPSLTDDVTDKEDEVKYPNSATSIDSNSLCEEEEDINPGYHWDYCDVSIH